MENNNHDATKGHNKVNDQMCAASLKCFTVQRFVLSGQTDCCDAPIGENNAANRRYKQQDSECQTIDIINDHTLAGKLEK